MESPTRTPGHVFARLDKQRESLEFQPPPHNHPGSSSFLTTETDDMSPPPNRRLSHKVAVLRRCSDGHRFLIGPIGSPSPPHISPGAIMRHQVLRTIPTVNCYPLHRTRAQPPFISQTPRHRLGPFIAQPFFVSRCLGKAPARLFSILSLIEVQPSRAPPSCHHEGFCTFL